MADLTNFRWPNHHDWSERDIALLKRALGEGNWSHGELASEFERAFASYVGVNHALLVPNGTSAVYLSLVALGIRQGDEVIIPGITWPSVVYAILQAGGTPRTVDIGKDTLCLDLSLLRSAISERTFAILATHLFASQCPMPDLIRLGEEVGVYILEDAAQAVGSAQFEKRCGAWGKTGAFSLNDRKVLACGEGGVIVTDDTSLFDELKKLQLIVPDRGSAVRNIPGTFKVSEFQAAVALAQLETLDERLDRIRKNAERLEDYLSDIKTSTVQKRPAGVTFQCYYNFCILYDGVVDAPEIRNRLSERLNLAASPPYKPISHIQDFSPAIDALSPVARAALLAQHPNCLSAYRRRCIRLPHELLLADSDIIEAVGEELIVALAQ